LVVFVWAPPLSMRPSTRIGWILSERRYRTGSPCWPTLESGWSIGRHSEQQWFQGSLISPVYPHSFQVRLHTVRKRKPHSHHPIGFLTNSRTPPINLWRMSSARSKPLHLSDNSRCLLRHRHETEYEALFGAKVTVQPPPSQSPKVEENSVESLFGAKVSVRTHYTPVKKQQSPTTSGRESTPVEGPLTSIPAVQLDHKVRQMLDPEDEMSPVPVMVVNNSLETQEDGHSSQIKVCVCMCWCVCVGWGGGGDAGDSVGTWRGK